MVFHKFFQFTIHFPWVLYRLCYYHLFTTLGLRGIKRGLPSALSKQRLAIGSCKTVEQVVNMKCITYVIYSIQMCAFRRGQIISDLIPVPKSWWCSVEVFIHISSFPRWDKFSHLVKCTWPRTTPEPQPEAPLVRPMPEPQQNQYINIYIVYATFEKIIALLN